MRIHTSATLDDIYQAARVAGVGFTGVSRHGSRKASHAFEVGLTGSSSHRSQWRQSNCQAATWDEWGIFLAAVFEVDPNASATYYANADDFHWQTGDRFRTLQRVDQHARHKWSYVGESVTGSYWVHECACGAIMRRGNYRDVAAEGGHVFAGAR